MSNKLKYIYSTVLAAIAGALLAIIVVLVSGQGSWENLSFRMGLYDKGSAEKELKETVELFNKLFVRFFTSGGDLEGLNIFPADNMVKRRVVQEINTWSSADRILSHDRISFEYSSVEFISATKAVVDTNEVWALILRNRTTGNRIMKPKSSAVKVRYLLFRREGVWRVMDFDVYGAADDIPELEEGRLM